MEKEVQGSQRLGNWGKELCVAVFGLTFWASFPGIALDCGNQVPLS